VPQVEIPVRAMKFARTKQEESALKKIKGFTLIELMIVVVVIAILAAIVVPNYMGHVRKTRRTQVKTDMLEYTQMLEREYTLNRSYAGFPVGTYNRSPRTGTQYYALTYTIPAAGNTYTITATPVGAQTQDNGDCGTMTLNSQGVKTATGGLGANGCW
jgi:type IV pilus assembly protein PilE